MKENMSKRKIEPIRELKNLCYPSEISSWFERNLYRIALYFTKPLLKMGISANQATLLSLLFALIGGFFLIFASNIPYLIISASLLYLYIIFDCVDGEIARYNKPSKLGSYFDFMVGSIVQPYIIICMTFGIYNALHDVTVFIFGFLAVIAQFLFGVSLFGILYKGVELSNKSKDTTDKKTFIGKYLREPVRRVSNFLLSGALIYAIIILTALDICFAPVSITIPIIGLFAVNARYAFLIVYGVGKLSSFILKIRSMLTDV